MRSILHSNPLRNAIKNQIQNNSNIASSQSQKRRLCLFCARLSSSSSSSATKVNSRPYSTFSVNLRNSNPYLTSSSCFGQTSIPSSSIHQSSRSISSKSTPPKTIQLSPTREPTMDLQEEDLDLFHTLNRIDRKVNLTERAVEKLISLCEKESNPNLALRLAVEPGGCHGYQYNMKVVDIGKEGEDGMEEDDYLFSHTLSTSNPANLLIDSASLPLLNLSTLDYATELIGSQFVVRENPNAKGGGCGCGVSWEPRDDLLGAGSVEAEKSGPISLGNSPGEIDIGEKGRSSRLGAL